MKLWNFSVKITVIFQEIRWKKCFTVHPSICESIVDNRKLIIEKTFQVNPVQFQPETQKNIQTAGDIVFGANCTQVLLTLALVFLFIPHGL